MPTRGDVTEAAVLNAFVGLEWDVCVPWRHDCAYDLVVSPNGERFFRVQCKSGRERDGCVIFNCHSTDHGKGALPYYGRADVFAVFCPTRNEVYVLPVETTPKRGAWLRVEPSRNNQVRGVRLAADHTIDRWAARVTGEVAA
jgi:hypothetical protein